MILQTEEVETLFQANACSVCTLICRVVSGVGYNLIMLWDVSEPFSGPALVPPAILPLS